MKKLVLFIAAIAALWACSDEKAPFNYRGLVMTMPLTQFMDSLQARGFAVDTAASDSGKTVKITIIRWKCVNLHRN